MRTNYVGPFGLGFSTGLRSATPLAALAFFGPRRLKRLRRPLGKKLAVAGALTELVNDKLPFTPSRLSAPLLSGRLLLGGLSGYLLVRRPYGALLGTFGALLGSYAGYYARRALTRSGRWKDLPVALGEDALAVGLARGAVAY